MLLGSSSCRPNGLHQAVRTIQAYRHSFSLLYLELPRKVWRAHVSPKCDERIYAKIVASIFREFVTLADSDSDLIFLPESHAAAAASLAIPGLPFSSQTGKKISTLVPFPMPDSKRMNPALCVTMP